MKEREHSPSDGQADWTIKTARDHLKAEDSPPYARTRTPSHLSLPKPTSELRHQIHSGKELSQGKNVEENESVPWCSTMQVLTDGHGSPSGNCKKSEEQTEDTSNKERTTTAACERTIPDTLGCGKKAIAARTSIVSGGWTSKEPSGKASILKKHSPNQLSSMQCHQKEVHHNTICVSDKNNGTCLRDFAS